MTARETKPLLFLIDGSNYIFRAYHAIPHLSTRMGEPTNAVLGFLNMLVKTLRDGEPTHVAVAFDTKAPTFRHERFPDYKANRVAPPEDLKPQIPRILEVVEAMNLPILREEGWEADDLIAALTRRAVDRGWEVVLVTGDKDLMQLVGPGVRMYDGMRDRWFGPEEVRAKFGVGPAQVADALALIGDASDNVPGVKGVGEKTAGPLIDRFGSVEALYERLDEVESKSVRGKLERGKDLALLSKALVTLREDAPVPEELDALVMPSPQAERLRTLLTELEMNRLLNELVPEAALSQEAYEVVLDPDGLSRLLETLRDARRFAVTTVTDPEPPMRARLVGLSFSTGEGHAWYLPLAHRDLGTPSRLSPERALEALRPLLGDGARHKFTRNLKHELLVLRRHDVTLRGVDGDPLLFDYLLDPGGNRGMEALVQRELSHTPARLEDVAGKGRKQRSLEEVAVEAVSPWACEDADCTWRLALRLGERVQADEGLWRVWETIERPLAPVLADMERAGVRVDRARLSELSEELGTRIAELEGRIHELAGRPFTIQSPKQLAEVLFEELELPVIKRTKTGPSTDVTVLEALADQHPLPRTILDYRHLSKLKGTYVDPLPALIHPDTGRVHTVFSQTTAATGRLSSLEPNLQNIPIRTDEGRRIREAFIADEGRVLVSADYSQIELRILAHLAEDAAFADAFRAGQDIHARTASEVLGVPLEAVTPDQRRIAKAINFGIVYGMSAFRLARDLGIERREAQQYIDGYFARHVGVKAWLDRTVEEARESGMVRTFFGRRRLVPDIRSRNGTARSAAERVAINTPIQGTAADVIKLAMLAVHDGLGSVSPEARLILQVHDELLVEVPEAEASRVAEWVREQMEGVVSFSVPLRVEVGTGKSWAAAH